MEILIAGLGSIGRRHLSDLQSLNETEIVPAQRSVSYLGYSFATPNQYTSGPSRNRAARPRNRYLW